MVFFLRTLDNTTLAEVEVYVKMEDDVEFTEVSSAIYVQNYSLHLIDVYESSNDMKFAANLIGGFERISEIRGWFYEIYLQGKQNTPELKDEVASEIQRAMKELADGLNLMMVED